jgi:hypothetical protein
MPADSILRFKQNVDGLNASCFFLCGKHERSPLYKTIFIKPNTTILIFKPNSSVLFLLQFQSVDTPSKKKKKKKKK